MVTAPLSQVVLIIAAGLLAARAGRAFRVPEAIPLLITGYVLGSDLLGFLKPDEIGIGIDVLAALAVPIILFYDGLKTEAKSVRENAGAVLAITTVAVVVTVAGIAFFSNLFLGLSWQASVLLGAILASTDPASIIPVLRKLNIKKKISAVLEAETALNDATAITIFSIVLGLSAGGQLSLRGGISQFAYLAVASGLLGVLIGFAFYELFKRFRIGGNIVFASLIVLLAAFGVAEFFQASSVITIVFSALIFRAFLQSPFVNASNRAHTLNVWEDLNFIATSAIFLVLGAQVQFKQAAPFLVVGVLIALAFMFVVRPLTVLVSLFFHRSFSFREKLAISWLGGPRGVVSAALAGIVLSRASHGLFSAPEATAIFNIAIIVISATVVTTGLTASHVTKSLLKVRENSLEDEYKRLNTELKTMMIALRRFRQEWKEGLVSTKIYASLEKELNQKMRAIEKKLESISRKAPRLKSLETAMRAREIVLNQITALENAYENKEIPETQYQQLLEKLRAQSDTLSEIEDSLGKQA